MLFLISSAPDTKEFKTAYKLAKDMNAEVCLFQNAVYASKDLIENNPPSPPFTKGGMGGLSGENVVYVLRDEMQLRGIQEDEISGKPIDYNQLIDLMADTDKVVGIF